MLDQLETFIIGTLHSIYDQFGWGGVFSMMIFENVTGITPGEVVLSLAGCIAYNFLAYQIKEGVRYLNCQETKVVKNIDEAAKNSWRHKGNLGVLRELAVRNYTTA